MLIGRAYVSSQAVRQWHDSPLPVLVLKYVDENGSAAMLVTKTSAGVVLKRNTRECTSRMPPPSVNKTAHFGFETKRRCYQRSKTELSVALQKD